MAMAKAGLALPPPGEGCAVRVIIGRRFDESDLDRSVSQEARDAMLDLILRWASLDGAVSQLYAGVFQKADEDHADEIASIPLTQKLREIQVALRPHIPKLAATLNKLKKQCERYRQARDTVAHCHLAGTLRSRPDCLVFLRYRQHKAGGLMVDAMPLGVIAESTRFAVHLRDVVHRIDAAARGEAGPKVALPSSGEPAQR